MRWVKRSPGYVAALMLREVFGADEPPAAHTPGRAFPLTDFQEAAARRAGAILQRWNGVLIADSVGLGKTYIALALIEEEVRRGRQVLVTVPASLRPLWRRGLRRLRARYPAAPIHLLSHAQLSRGSYAASLAGHASFVVVDEAHRFRNPRTRRYAALLELGANARVALLTATPVNNGTGDLYHLLRLFADDDSFIGLGVPGLAEVFDDRAPPGAGAQRILREIMVRRTRAIVRGRNPGGMEAAGPVRFPHRATPRIVRVSDPRMPALISGITDLELAAYAPGDAVDDHTYGGVAALVRLGLLKRLESSTTALAASIQRQLAFSRAFLTALERGRLLRPGRPAGGRAGQDVDPLQLLLFDLVAERCPPGLDPAPLAAAVQRDVERLEAMRRLLAAGPDPKLDALREHLGPIAPEKVVLFTEFRDTAGELWRRLASDFAVARIDGGGAWLGGRPAGRGVVVERFAPRSNGAADPPQRERVDVLVVTDVLSEGANLQDARHVVSYDLPWNPVRLMQRIGRVDRLGSPHAEVVPHLFLPAASLEESLGITRSLRRKITTITTSIGDDDDGRLLARLRHGAAEAAAVLDDIEARNDDPMEALRLRWQTARGGTAPDCPPRDPKQNGNADDAIPIAWIEAGDAGRAILAIVAVRFHARPWLVEVGPDGQVREPGRDAAGLLATALDRTTRDPGPRPRRSDGQTNRVVTAVRAHFHSLDSLARAPRPIAPSDPTARIATRLRRAMAAPGAWARPDLLARADRALERLDRPLHPRDAGRARRMIAGIDDDSSPAELLDQVEELVADLAPPERTVGRAPPPRERAHRAPPHLTIASLLLVDDGWGRG